MIGYGTWDYTVEHLMTEMLIELARTVHGYPDTIAKSFKEWQKTIYCLGKSFQRALELEAAGEYDKAYALKEKAWHKLARLHRHLWD